MGSANDIGGKPLFEDELHVVRAVGPVVWCVVCVPPRTPPAAGAAAAQRVGEFLIANVLQRRSPWLGLILDARQGPSVFGPITRDVTVRFMESAEAAHKPFAVLTGSGPTQHQQYLALATAHAPRFARVTADAREASAWMTTTH